MRDVVAGVSPTGGREAGPLQGRLVRVLLVESDSDEASRLQALMAQTRRIRLETSHAGDLAEAEARLSQQPFDAILLDLDLGSHFPGGPEAMLRALRASAPAVPVLALASTHLNGIADRALVAGAHDCLSREELTPALLERSIMYATERGRAEEAIRQSERSYEQLVNSLDSIVWEGDASTLEFTFVSKQAERLLGYPVERWTTEPDFWRAHMHPDDRGWAPSYGARATAESRAHEFEYRMLAADGRIVWLRDIVTVVVEDGTPVKLRGVMIDITEQKKVEADLKEKEEQYRGIFEATTDGLVINDWDGAVVEVNPAFYRMHGYTHDEMVGMDPRTFIHPNSYGLLREFFDTVRAGRMFHCRAMDVRKDGTPFHVEVHGTNFTYKGQPHVLGVVIDVTEQVNSYELLEQRVKERTQELTTLLEVSSNVASTLELKPLLGKVLDQLKSVTDYTSASILVVDGDELMTLDSQENTAEQPGAALRRYPLNPDSPLWRKLITHECIIIPDIRAGDEIVHEHRAVVDQLLKVRPYTRSWMGAPLALGDKVIGLLSLSNVEPNYYTARHARLAVAVANQATIAIENARLYEQAQETARKTAALAQTASQVAFGGDLESTLDVVCKHVVDVTGAVAAAVVLREGDSPHERMVGEYGLPEGYAAAFNSILAAGTPMLLQDAFKGRKPMSTQGMRQLISGNPGYAPLHSFMRDVAWDTVVAVPIVYRDSPVGVLLSYHLAAHEMGDAEMTFHSIIADQAAVAVENARLVAQARDKASLEERQRLARELHDSVTQALFSISLIARSAELMIAREPNPAAHIIQKMADLRQLTQGALAEMRALIFELRPGALQEEGLVEALRKHAAAIQGRDLLPVQLVLDGNGGIPRLKPAAEEALYRIAQEALHNVVKHAKATKVEVWLGSDGSFVTLRVTDDGTGFDASKVPAGHMGLGTMRQRAEALAGHYAIKSSPGEGTTIVVRVPLKEWQSHDQ